VQIIPENEQNLLTVDNLTQVQRVMETIEFFTFENEAKETKRTSD